MIAREIFKAGAPRLRVVAGAVDEQQARPLARLHVEELGDIDADRRRNSRMAVLLSQRRGSPPPSPIQYLADSRCFLFEDDPAVKGVIVPPR